jgi:lipopolysaccharide transport system ATP-binding protein
MFHNSVYRRPSWIGFGTMKSGSSWIWEQLRCHPDVRIPKDRGRTRKELHFFDVFDYTSRRYLKAFGRISKKYSTGEYTPSYICFPHAPIIIKEWCPDVKLFTVFRNPVDRAFSHYKDHLQRKKIPLGSSFRESFDNDYPPRLPKYVSIKAKGMYADQLEYWYQFFPKEQIKVMFYEDLVKEPIPFIQDLYKWLGINDTIVPKHYDMRIVKTYNKIYKDMKIKEEDRLYVQEYYASQVDKLQTLTGRDLPEWKK